MFLNGAAHRIVTGDNFQPSDLTVSQMASLLCAGRNMIHRPNSQILWVQFQTHQRKVRGVTFAGQGLAFSLCLKKKKKKNRQKATPVKLNKLRDVCSGLPSSGVLKGVKGKVFLL